MNRFESITDATVSPATRLPNSGKRVAGNKPLKWSMALLLVALVAGCGGGRDSILGGSGVIAALAPTVTAVAPANNATGVSINNTTITAALSDPIAPLTGAASFTVTCAASCVSPTGTVTLDATNKIATFTLTPATTLATASLYTATITGATSLATGLVLASPYVWHFTTGVTPDTTRPTVTLTVPAAGAAPVAINTRISATFSEDMAPATLNAASFTVTCAAPCVSPTGTVSYAIGTRAAVFTPAAVLAAGKTYTATITTAATDLAGNALAVNKVWSFTTGAAADTTAPTVTLVNPADLATGVAINSAIHATFSEAMDPLTIKTATFTLQASGPPLGPILAGAVTYDPITNIAAFTPSSNLALSTKYTAAVTTGTTDLAGNALAVNKVWSFTTKATAVIPPAVNLQSVAPFGATGGTGITSCGNTLINGDVATTSASTLITGLTDGNGLGNSYTIAGCPGIVNGKIYTAPPAPGDAASMSIATQAQTDAQTAFDATSTASMPGGVTQTAELGALTLAPGVYWSGTSFSVTLVDLTLDAQGDPNATWVFQSDSTLTVGVNRKVILTNGAQAKNIFWHVSSAATVNAGAQMKGTILAFSGVSMGTGATLDGRAISLVGGPVTLLNNVINVPAP